MKKYKSIVLILSIVLLLGTMVPLMCLGLYTHPLGDDYYFGIEAHKVISNGGNVFEVIGAAAKRTAEEYQRWQGTYSAMFLMCLPPQIFGEGIYKIFPSALILLFTGGVFALFYELICKWLSADKKTWIIVASLVVTLCLQGVPYEGENLYWYNGAMYYTGFLSISLFFFAVCFNYIRTNNKWMCALLCVMGIFIAGGNYVSLLPSMVLINLILAYLIISKSKIGTIIGIAISDAGMLWGFLVSAVAPGNAYRQANLYKIPAYKAILKAILQGGKSAILWTTFLSFLILMLVTPILIDLIRQKQKVFKYWYIICPLLFGVYCSSCCPTFYAQNNPGPARAFDLYWYILCIVGIVIYYVFLTFLVNKFKNLKVSQMVAIAEGAVMAIAVLILVIRHDAYYWDVPNSIYAASEICNGDAKYYDDQYKSRMKMVKDEKLVVLEFEPYDVPDNLQFVLFVGDFTDDPNGVNNVSFAEYYNKVSVVVKDR